MPDNHEKNPESDLNRLHAGDLGDEGFELQPPVDVIRPNENPRRIQDYEADSDESVERFRFHIADVMTIVTGISVAFAGGTWIRSEIFALLLGLVVLVGIAVVSFHPLETRRQSVLWVTLVLSYVSSTIAAFIRSH